MDIAAMLISRHGEEFHRKMQCASIGLAGLGGLGSSIAVALTRMGLGRLIAYDFDVVDLSNIHRQQYYIDQIGQKKVDALKETLSRISTLTKFDFSDTKIDETNVGSLFQDCDIIIEAVDDSIIKAMLFEARRRYYPTVYYIGASGVAGYVNEPPLRAKQLGDKAFIVGDFITDVSPFTSTVLTASRVGIAAHMQANLAVKLIMEKI